MRSSQSRIPALLTLAWVLATLPGCESKTVGNEAVCGLGDDPMPSLGASTWSPEGAAAGHWRPRLEGARSPRSPIPVFCHSE